MDGLYQNILEVESRVVQVQDQTSDFLQLKVGELISDSLKFDVCSQELVGYRPDKEVEILEIDESPARLIPGGDFNECSAYSNIFSGTHTTWGNGHELLTENHDVYRHFGMNVQRLSEKGTSWEHVLTGDLYFSRMILVPGVKELYIIGGSKDLEASLPSDQVTLIKGKDEIQAKKPLTVPRSKVSLALGRTQDQMSVKNYIFAVGGQESDRTSSKAVERYHLRANIWQTLPNLAEGRTEASSVVLGDSIYVFGGLNISPSGEMAPLRTIERLNLKQSGVQTFSTLDLKLPFSATNVGLLPVSHSEALILGGFSGDASDQKLRFAVNHDSEPVLEALSTRMERGDFFQGGMTCGATDSD